MDYYLQELGGCGCANGGTCPECGPSESTPALEVKSSSSPSKKVAIPVITSPDYYASLVSSNGDKTSKASVTTKSATPAVNKILPEPKKEVIQQVKPLPVSPAAICDDTGFAIATGGFAMMFLIAVAINSD